MAELTHEERIKNAFEAAMKYLAASWRSEKEVREKLYLKGYHKNEVEETIEKCKYYNYVNDENYVRVFIDFYGKKYGKGKIIYKLTFEKGVDKHLAESIVEELISDDSEVEKCALEAEKYIAKKHITEKKDFNKVNAYLYSKGYSYEIISKSLNTLNLDEND